MKIKDRINAWGKMKKIARDKYYDQVERMIFQYGDEDDQWIIEYAENLIKTEWNVEDLENSYVKIPTLHSRSMVYLFASIIIGYEDMKRKEEELVSLYYSLGGVPPYLMNSEEEKVGKMKRIEKDTWYSEVNVEDIFPIDEFTAEEVKFLEPFLDKIHVDLEYRRDILISTKQLVHLLTGIIREYDNFRGTTSENHSEN
jgi:hypothetical protein